MTKIHGRLDLILNGKSMLFNIEKDEDQMHPINDDLLEQKYVKALREALISWQAPKEHLERLELI